MPIRGQAILAYGVLCKNSNFDAWKDFVASKHDLKSPTGLFKGNEEAFKEYYKKRDLLIKKLGVSIEPYGSNTEFHYLFCIKDSIFMASRGFEEIVKPEYIKVDKEWDSKLKYLCTLFDVKFENPNFYLISHIEVG